MSSFKKILLLTSIALSLAMLPTTRVFAADEPAAKHELTAAEGGIPQAAHPEAEEEGREAMVGSVWALIIFVVMLMILYPTAWRSIVTGLKSREERIRKDIADAEANRAKADAALKDRMQQLATAEAKTRELLAEAKTQGEKLAGQLTAQAQRDVEDTKVRTQRDIEAAGRAAVRDIHQQAAQLSSVIAEKIVRKNLTDSDQADLLRQGLDQLQSIGKN